MAYNRNDPAQLTILQAELAKPAYTGAAAAVGDQGLADMLNSPDPNITVRRGIRASSDVMGGIVGTEFAALTAGARDYILALISAGQVDLANDNVRNSLAAAFPAASASRAALLALADKTPASWAEQKFGINTQITGNDVAYALRPPA